MCDMDGRVALITGGTSGIGRATAEAFARRGACVVIAARDATRGARVEAALQSTGANASFVPADMGDPRQIRLLVDETVSRFGRLDYAFNNAVCLDYTLAPLHELPAEEFDRTLAVNLKGVWLCMKYEIEQMLRQSTAGGAIVNASSVNGLGATPMGAFYSATKAGVLGLTKAAALEYAQSGIRVNAVVPGPIRTPSLEDSFARIGNHTGQSAAHVDRETSERNPSGRLGTPNEVAETVVWLCSEASSFVVGHSMIVDGGETAYVR